MKYKQYTALDYAKDSFFIRWVRHADEESNFFWQTFMLENPSCRSTIEEARELVLSFDYQRHHLSDEAMTQLRNKLWMHFLAEKQIETPSKQRSGWWFSAAAIMVPLVLFAGYLCFYKATAPTPTAFHDEREDVIVRGENSLIMLADGSRIWLKDSSTVTYKNDFTGHPTRDIHLEGEGFFEVAKDTKHPFIVHTSALKIKVLGTSFSVKSYPGDKTVETTLVSGKVHIEQSDDKGKRVGDVELKPYQQAVFHKASKVINIRHVNNASAPAWKRDRLVFDEESIADILLQLERWYGVDIHVGTQKLGCRLTATIEKESLEEVLGLLQLAHGITYTIEGNNVFVTGNFCK